MMALCIRAATGADAEALAGLAREFAGTNPSPSPSSGIDLARAITSIPQLLKVPHVNILVAERLQRVVGCVVFSSMPSLVHGGRLLVFVDLIVVAESERRRGIGKQLMSAVIDRARRIDAYKVVLTTRSDNVPGLALHRFCGFVDNGLALAFYLSV